jgi:hypothetical protein
MGPRAEKLKGSSGLAGAGGGTLLVVFAKTLPKPWSELLVLVAPSVSVGISALFWWSKQYFEHRLKERELQLLVEQARKTLETALANPNTSPEHKAEMRQALEKLEKLLVQGAISRIDALRTKPA